MQSISVVVGGQYGSEAKGHVTAQLVRQALRHTQDDITAQVINIRVAGPNAGHTVYDDEGREWKFRQLPVGAAISEEVICYIAPGSEVELEVLLAELLALGQVGVKPTLLMSKEVTLLTDEHKQAEANARLVSKIGSTGKGIGAARAARLMRQAERLADNQAAMFTLQQAGVQFREPSEIYSNDFTTHLANQMLIVEGTQGFGLGLHAGHYPKVTSSDCTALDFLGMAQLSPWRSSCMSFEVWVVARAFPIRVAGDSGPMEGETTWESLGLPEERTTVTNKVRRVGTWDPDLVRRAVQANGGRGIVRVALTMADQIIPGIRGLDGSMDRMLATSAEDLKKLSEWVTSVSQEVGVPVGAVTTSPSDILWIES